MCGSFNVVQMIALAGMVIGSVFCLTGISAPDWIVSDNFRVGLWNYCSTGLAGLLGDDCKRVDSDKAYVDATRACALVCMLLGSFCSIAGLAMCWCQESSTIIIGVFTFIGGVFGCTAIGVFVNNLPVFITIASMLDVCNYGWAFALFCTGTSTLIIASFAAVLASPRVLQEIVQVKVAPAPKTVCAANMTTMNVQ